MNSIFRHEEKIRCASIGCRVFVDLAITVLCRGIRWIEPLRLKRAVEAACSAPRKKSSLHAHTRALTDILGCALFISSYSWLFSPLIILWLAACTQGRGIGPLFLRGPMPGALSCLGLRIDVGAA
jgi:hypothetical protein